MSSLRFRSSGAGNLKTNKKGVGITEKQLEQLDELTKKLEVKGLTEKQTITFNELTAKKNAPFELSDTSKSWVEKLWRKREKNVEEFLSNKYIIKGLSEEQMGINLLSKLDGNYYKKNTKQFDNGVLSGEPDIIFGDYVIDIKSSWNLETYMGSEMTELYYCQLQCYMELTGKRKAKLCYCLVDTPDKLVNDEKRRVQWKLGIDDPELDEYRPIFQQIETNMFFSHYPNEERVKTFEVEYDEDYIKDLYVRCEAAIKYYQAIKLGGYTFYKHKKQHND